MMPPTIDQWTSSIDVPSLLSFHTSNVGSDIDRLSAVIAPPHARLSILTPPVIVANAHTRFRLNTEDGAVVRIVMPSAPVGQMGRFNPAHGAFCQCTACMGRWLHDDASVRPCGCLHDPPLDASTPIDAHDVQRHHFRHFIDDVDRLLRTQIVADPEPIGFGGLSIRHAEAILIRTFQLRDAYDDPRVDVMECRAKYGRDIPIYNADRACEIRDGQCCRVHLEYVGPRFFRCHSYWNKWRAVGVYVEPMARQKRR